jgi:hypothetical protein
VAYTVLFLLILHILKLGLQNNGTAMKYFILTAFFFLSGLAAAMSQSTATNFTATDCYSSSHTLFDDLDAGKVVVLVWVMPCAVCISDAKAGFDAASSFAASNPGRVVFYLSDDVGDAGCGTLNSWASTNGMLGVTTFSNSGNIIDESKFGGPGMPHVVVMGGTDHKIYENLRGGANHYTEIRNAIQSAMSATAVGNVGSATPAVAVYPNPSSGSINVACTLQQAGMVNIDIIDIRGVKVQSVSQYKPGGEQSIRMPLDNSVSNGFYQLRLTASGVTGVAGFNVAR